MNHEETGEPKPPREKAAQRRMRWPRTPAGMSMVGFSQVGLFLIVVCYVLHEMKAVLLPLVLAILISLVLQPVYLALRKIKLPRLMAAAMTMIGLMAALAFGAYQAVLPAADWMRNVDEEEVLERVQEVFRPMKVVQAELSQIATRVEKAATVEKVVKATPAEREQSAGEFLGNPDKKFPEGNGAEGKVVPEIKAVQGAPFIAKENGAASDDDNVATVDPVQVEIHEDPMAILLAEMRDFGLGTVSFLLLVLFILAYGRRITNQLNENELMATILGRMASDVSHYLFTITIINGGLGICIGLAMWGMGMPRPVLWGVMAMVLNFIPYLGAVLGTFVIFLAAAVNFEQAGMVLAVPLVYFGLTAIEGNLVTPTVLGGRFRINPLVVFVWIFAWAGFWGVAGMLIAMPALVIFKIVCENTRKLEKFQRVLSA
ncbi:AI-2E family transporter [Luteolibacter algae]|uniref:AI-2E family transporter n=1 Tax=Luteolibacter algae TaxID=454151 RepID=A0ABW5D8Q7_9BACT